MANKCIYPGCKTGYAIKKNKKNIAINTLRLYSFPKDVKYYNLWEKYTNRDDIESIKNKYLCELHFESNSFDPDSKKFKLKPDAVPAIDFDITDQSFTILTPNKGEHLIDIKPKASKLDFQSSIGGPYLDMESNIREIKINNELDSKFHSSEDIVKYIKFFLG